MTASPADPDLLRPEGKAGLLGQTTATAREMDISERKYVKGGGGEKDEDEEAEKEKKEDKVEEGVERRSEGRGRGDGKDLRVRTSNFFLASPRLDVAVTHRKLQLLH